MRICSLFNDDGLTKTLLFVVLCHSGKKDAIEEQIIKHNRTVVPGGGVLFHLGAYYLRDWERTAATVVVKETH